MNAPTASQCRFMRYMAELGCCISPEMWRVQIHHVVGRSAKVKGVGNIGHWFILPLAWRYHDVDSNDPLNVTHRKNAFVAKFGKQSENFEFCLALLETKAQVDKSIDPADFPPKAVVAAILAYGQ